MTTRISHWIDGRPTAGTSGRTSPVYNPATGAVTGEVDLASVEELDAAVASASAAAKEWRHASLSRRSAVLFAFRELLHERTPELAAIVTAEHGKVLSDAAGRDRPRPGERRVRDRGAQPAQGRLQRAGRHRGRRLQHPPAARAWSPVSRRSTSPRWCRCGCAPTRSRAATPSSSSPREKDPSAALFLAQLWKEAGLPDGIFTVLHGDKVAVDAILDHPGIAAVSFVGSTPIAKYIYERGTANGKRVQALGGAKNHALVLPDADVDMAADSVVSAAYGSAGERCMALSVAVAVGEVAQPLVDAIAARLPKLTVGNGADPDSDMGPLITAEHRDKVAWLRRGRPGGRGHRGRRRPRGRPARPRASSSAPRCSTTSPPR